MIKAKKRFGQNFLKDENIVNTIVKAIPKNDYTLVEIGAGLGDLTQYLLKSQDVVAFEIDLDLCKYLKEKFVSELKNGKLKLICGDVLDFWEGDSLLDNDYKIVANLPYYVATKIIFKALNDKKNKNITVMIQKEVADKFLANVGDKEFSSLSVIAQSVSTVHFVVDAPPNSFEPPPKVNSTVIEFNKNGNSIPPEFQNFLKYAFKQPRKTLAKNLSSRYEKEKILSLFQDMNLNQSIRPHQVKTIDYHQIYTILEGSDIGRERARVKTTKQ